MKVHFQQSEFADEPYAVITARERDSRVEAAIRVLESLETVESLGTLEREDLAHQKPQPQEKPENTGEFISGKFGTQVSLIPLASVSYFYAHDKRVFARYSQHDWQINTTLKNLETSLNASIFVRVSNSAIINMRAVSRFDLNLGGYYIAVLKDGVTVKVSASYVTSLKRYFMDN